MGFFGYCGDARAERACWPTATTSAQLTKRAGGLCRSSTSERAVLQNRVELLDPKHVDPDMVDELVRKELNVVHPDEVIVPLNEIAGRGAAAARLHAARVVAPIRPHPPPGNAGSTSWQKPPRANCRRTAACPTASGPPSRSRIEASKDELLEFYHDMLLIRRFEEKAGQLYGLGLIGGFCHLYIGQEAVAVGLQSALTRQGQRHHRLPRPRPHARCAASRPRTIMAELTGRAAGISQGQGRVDAHVQRRA